MEAAARKIKAGPFTLALALIALGAGILASNMGLLDIRTILKMWPLLLIGLGVEYFIRRILARESEVHFSIPGTVLIGLMAVSMAGVNALYGLTPGIFLDHAFFRGGHEYVRQWQGQPVALIPGTRLEIENRVGDVEITPSPDGRMHLSARITGSGSSEATAREAAEGQNIIVESRRVTRVYTGPERNTVVKLFLEVPAGLDISVSDRLGSITVQKTDAENLELEASMGRVIVEQHTGKIKVINRMGEVSLKNITGDTNVEASMGRVTVANPLGDVMAVCRSGSLSLTSEGPLDKKYTLQADNGQVAFRLPRSSNLKIEASTQNGGITGMENSRSTPGSKARGETTLGGGKGSALLETKNGAVKVEIVD